MNTNKLAKSFVTAALITANENRHVVSLHLTAGKMPQTFPL